MCCDSCRFIDETVEQSQLITELGEALEKATRCADCEDCEYRDQCPVGQALAHWREWKEEK